MGFRASSSRFQRTIRDLGWSESDWWILTLSDTELGQQQVVEQLQLNYLNRLGTNTSGDETIYTWAWPRESPELPTWNLHTLKLKQQFDGDDVTDLEFIDIYSQCSGLCGLYIKRTQDLRHAFSRLQADQRDIAAASIARALMETAGSLHFYSQKIAEMWRSCKTTTGSIFPIGKHSSRYIDRQRASAAQGLRQALSAALNQGRFSVSPESYQMMTEWRSPSATVNFQNDFTFVSPSVSKFVHFSGQYVEYVDPTSSWENDYELLSNAVHPSIGTLIAFAGPPLTIVEQSHFVRRVVGNRQSRKRFQRSPAGNFGTAELLESIDRSASAAITILEVCLKGLTTICDDIYLTANAGRYLCLDSWRTPSVPNSMSAFGATTAHDVSMTAHSWMSQSPIIDLNVLVV